VAQNVVRSKGAGPFWEKCLACPREAQLPRPSRAFQCFDEGWRDRVAQTDHTLASTKAGVRIGKEQLVAALLVVVDQAGMISGGKSGNRPNECHNWVTSGHHKADAIQEL
jgi:hypothetical protein